MFEKTLLDCTASLQIWKSSNTICSCNYKFVDAGPPCPFFLVRSYKILPVPAQNYLKKNTLFYLFQKQKYLKNLARSKLFNSPYLWTDIAGSYSFTSNLKIIWWKTDIGSFRNSFGSSFVNWEVTGPHKFLIKVIWNIVFLSLLSLCYTLICSNNKNIWKVWQEVSSFNKFT